MNDQHTKYATQDFVKEYVSSYSSSNKPESVDYIILNSSTPGSTKQFKVTIGDDGVLTTTEI